MTRNVRIAPVVARLLTALGLAVPAWVAAALVGGALPSNAGWRPAAPDSPGTVTIWVEANAVHTDIVMPKVAAGVDWRRFARETDLADPRYAGYDHIAIGWGEQGFYRETTTWRELRPRVVLNALTGSDETVMHVEHLPRPRAGGGARPVVLTPTEYRRLASFIAASFRRGGGHYQGYGPNDVFYAGRGRYDAIRTCNSWTGKALRHAGVRVGRWTPLPVTVMWWF